jgi:NADH-quinone oxidoreductase subunit G
MPKVTINGNTIEVPEGTNLVAAAEMAGEEIPHYCYHPGLSVAGNCRMCLVDIKALSEKQPNPLPKLQIGSIPPSRKAWSSRPGTRKSRTPAAECLSSC